MIETDKRKAIYQLHLEGMSLRQIARRLGVSRNTVKEVIKLGGQMPPQSVQSDQPQIDPELLRRLYAECEGRIQRVYEKLVEHEGVQVKYSTLTRLMRKLGISRPTQQRCERVPDEPGQEMQHDTTLYRIEVGGTKVRLVASCLYLRYSKRRYLKFYHNFNRFKMKCFFHEALMFWGYSARQCIIDNTNLARLRGTGKNAIICPEMVSFSGRYGFEFVCHALNHPNRKAGEERSFWTVETNFLPGRCFQDFEDLNQQALEWSTVRMEQRPQGAGGLIPAKAFEHECVFLLKLTPHLPAPYQILARGTDQYGYAAFEGNYYWVPGTGREEVKVLEYSERIQIYLGRQCVAEYRLPAQGVKNQRFPTEGLPAALRHPKNCKHSSQEEEKRLRAMGPPVQAYLDFALGTQGLQRHQFIRKLWTLSRQMSCELFCRTLERACKYHITRLETLQRIAQLYLGDLSGPVPTVPIDEQFQTRPAYQEGFLTEQPDLSLYNTNTPTDDE